jgi:hypothetical protein
LVGATDSSATVCNAFRIGGGNSSFATKSCISHLPNRDHLRSGLLAVLQMMGSDGSCNDVGDGDCSFF